MTARIGAGAAGGTLYAPPSKSMAHRALICAALAQGESVVEGLSSLSEDILATIDCLRALGATITLSGDTATVVGMPLPPKARGELLCRECGTTLRLLLPLCLLSGEAACLSGTEKLLSRPLGAYKDLCEEKGFLYEKGDTAVTVAGTLTAGHYTLPGDVSSQYISGLLYALSLCPGESTLTLTGDKIESRSYVDLTLSKMAEFGVTAAWLDHRTLKIWGGAYQPRHTRVEGDWSNAAFFLALSSLGDDVTVLDLKEDSLQGDRVILPYLEALREGTPTLSVADCPDLAPILMTVAALQNGAVLTHTARLAMKESDRGTAMAEELKKCGVNVVVEENSITVPKATLFSPTRPLLGHNDHRIVMALSVLLTRLGGSIEGYTAVSKSYPDFFEVLKNLGVSVTL